LRRRRVRRRLPQQRLLPLLLLLGVSAATLLLLLLSQRRLMLHQSVHALLQQLRILQPSGGGTRYQRAKVWPQQLGFGCSRPRSAPVAATAAAAAAIGGGGGSGSRREGALYIGEIARVRELPQKHGLRSRTCEYDASPREGLVSRHPPIQ
jgi:hypothetical protein